MPIPKTREELVGQVERSYRKLRDELEGAPADLPERRCVDDWTVKDLLAVRTWWTERVVDWIEAGREGREVVLPAEGYGWSETPRLNEALVEEDRATPYPELRDRLQTGYERVCRTIDGLSDRELLEPGVFEWAGKWPLARWISMNTGRQYATARTYVRRALRDTGS